MSIASLPVDNDIEDSNTEDYKLRPGPISPFYIDEHAATGSESTLLRLNGVDAVIAHRIVSERPAGGYRRVAQLTQKGLDWQRAVDTPRLRVRIYQRT